MREQNERLNEPDWGGDFERRLRRLEPLPPSVDRDGLMYRAGFAAALAQQPAARRQSWLVPAGGGFLAATAAGLLAWLVWAPHPAAPPAVLVAESPVETRPADEPRPEEHDREAAAPAGGEAAGESGPHDFRAAAAETDAWAIVSASLAQRHGMRWDEPMRRGADEEHSLPRPDTPSPTVLELMREAGTLPEREAAPTWYPLMRLIEEA